jgi:hypothetical protein
MTADIGAAHALSSSTQMFQPLAGVLLGKTSLDWLYGQMNRPPRTVPQFCAG